MKIKIVQTVIIALFFFLWNVPSASAARNFSITQSPVAASAVYNMATTQAINYTIYNTSTTADRIYMMRFRLNGTCTAPCTVTTYSNTTAAPTNWTRTAYSTTSITFRANSWANAVIPPGGSLVFTIVYNMGAKTADITENMRDARASFTLTTNFCYSGCAPLISASRSGTVTKSGASAGSWTLRSLLISPFQTVDTCATANPISVLTAGYSFSLLMTVRNISSTSQSSIVVVDAGNRPTAHITGTVTLNAPAAVYTPNPLTLAAGASGTICFTYTTNVSDSGSVYFTASVRNSTSTATSLSATSNTLQIAPVVQSIAISGPTVTNCLFNGDIATFTMVVTNNSGTNVTNVTPSALSVTLNNNGGSVNIGAFTGPAPACYTTIAKNGGTGTFTWTATMTGTVGVPKPTFLVTGNALYNRTGSCPAPTGGTASWPATSNTQDLDGSIVTVNPDTTNASSSNGEIVWTVMNYGCAAIQSVSVNYPAVWIYGNDAYSIINDTDESWTIAGANPVVFTANPNPIPVNQSGDFNLVFAATPISSGTNTFTITIIDASTPPITRIKSIPVTVDVFKAGGLNDTGTGVWHEDIR